MRRVVAFLVLASAVGAAGQVSAQSTVTGPTVSLDVYEVAPGDPIVLTIDGFNAPGVTISVCGNDARRGAADCNMPQSEGRGLIQDGSSTLASMPVYAPPVPCPCVIRVSTSTNDQVAVVPITIIGHPVGPVTNPDVPQRVPLDVSLVVNASTAGLGDVIRSSLGGASTYEVSVTVSNRSTSEVDGIALTGSAGRDAAEELVTLDLPDPGALNVGETWRETVVAELPALTFGEVEWQVTTTGAGPSVQATDTTSQLPVLLVLLGIVLVVDVLVLIVRFLVRLRRRNADDDEPVVTAPDGGGDSAIEEELLVGSSVRNEPVREFAS